MHGSGNRSVPVIPRLSKVTVEVASRHDGAIPAGHVVEAGREGGVSVDGEVDRDCIQRAALGIDQPDSHDEAGLDFVLVDHLPANGDDQRDPARLLGAQPRRD
eukprot:1187449-Alexandrium_andersonii.AAC.1